MKERQHQPFVPPTVRMREFTLRAVLLGLVMTVVLGAANAYLGLRAGQTIAATYPAAVISMAVLRLVKGSILEENMARTVGSIGESVAAGAIFTIPAFVIAGAWPSFEPGDAYLTSTALMFVGGVLGIMFVTLLRRVMVEDPDLPYPESVAASEIHKSGQSGSGAAKLLFYNMGIGGLVYILGEMKLFSASNNFLLSVGELGRSVLRLRGSVQQDIPVGAVTQFSAPAVSPAYLGVGFIIGPRLASLNFSGGVVAWGLLVPMLMYFLGPQLAANAGGAQVKWSDVAGRVWYDIVRPIAVGGMLVGACYTLFKMRNNLAAGMARAFADLKKAGSQAEAADRTQQDLGIKVVLAGIAGTLVSMILLYLYFTGTVVAALVAAVVMLILGFLFAAVSGNLVGVIGSSNNPISGLTLSTVIVAALLMVIMGVTGVTGVAAVLGVAAVVCVSSAVSGEMLQDLKVGHILGGNPRSMQIGDLIGVAAASLLLYFPLYILHIGNINEGGIGFGDAKLAAPQAGLMATLSQGIVGGQMAWPLVVVGVMMGLALIMLQVRSPMLFSVGMYLPLETTFAIFTGGIIRWVTDSIRDRRGLNEAQKARVENAGVLTASGLIAGEALLGLVKAGFSAAKKPMPEIFATPPLIISAAVLLFIAAVMIRIPLANAGRRDEPAPPSAMM